MKKRMILLLGLLLTLSLWACTGPQEPETLPPEESQPTTETTAAAEQPENQAADAYMESLLEQKEELRTVLLDDEAVHLELALGMDFDTGGPMYLLTMENKTQDPITLYLGYTGENSLMLDDNITLDTYIWENLAPGEIKTTDKLTGPICNALLFLPEAESRRLTGKLLRRAPGPDGETENFITEVDAPLPRSAEPGLIWEPFRGCLAEPQVLAENEDFTLTLLGAGLIRGSSYEADYFRGLVCFENKTDRELPLIVDAVVADGVTLPCYLPDGTFARPHTAVYMTFAVDDELFNALDMTSFRELSLLVLTDISENQDYTANIFGGNDRRLAGGKLYPAALSQSGAAYEAPAGGETIFEQDGIRVDLLGCSPQSFSNLAWYFWVTNDGDQELHIQAYTVDRNDPSQRAGYLSGDFENIAPHSQGLVAPGLFNGIVEGWPDCDLRLRITTAGGDAFLGEAILPAPKGETRVLAQTEEFTVTYIGQSAWDEKNHMWYLRWENRGSRNLRLTAEVLDTSQEDLEFGYRNYVDMDPGELGADYFLDMEQPNPHTDVTFRVCITDKDTKETVYTGEPITIPADQ